MTSKEAAQELRVSLATIRSWRFYGVLPGIKVGRRVLFKREVIEKIQNQGLNVDGIRKS